jgi:hypothetical protein
MSDHYGTHALLSALDEAIQTQEECTQGHNGVLRCHPDAAAVRAQRSCSCPVQCVAAEHTLVAVTARFVIVADSISSPLQSELRAPAAGIRRASTRRRYGLCSRSSIAPAVRSGASLLAHTATRNNHSLCRSGSSAQLALAPSPSARMRLRLLAALQIMQLCSRRHRSCRRCSVVSDQDPAAKAAAADTYAQARSTETEEHAEEGKERCTLPSSSREDAARA